MQCRRRTGRTRFPNGIPRTRAVDEPVRTRIHIDPYSPEPDAPADRAALLVQAVVTVTVTTMLVYLLFFIYVTVSGR